MAVWPDQIEIKLESTKQSTFVLRCRDAVRSWVNNEWKTAQIDRNTFLTRYALFYINFGPDKSTVIIGPRYCDSTTHVFRESELIHTPRVVQVKGNAASNFFVDQPTDEELTALLVLANRNFFAGTTLSVRSVSKEQKFYIDSLKFNERFPNVVMDPTIDPYTYNII